ncbi:efflux transporter outer membrane subunit [Pseudothauera lacus]|uniref:Transporter n=1 Tax=Pseudothauera lacus TaxID=2136175 RepID=A0A2T4IBH5_9RHOO|nr:efflux transporter outer membrane subunit [Pseudothauera lacus]PTD95135.1 transporter [Pseudothauera lacus]
MSALLTRWQACGRPEGIAPHTAPAVSRRFARPSPLALAQRLGGILSSLLLTGCLGMPAFSPPTVETPAQWRSTPVDARSEAALTKQTLSSIYPVPELDALISEALSAGSDARIAAERVTLARLQVGLEAASALPQLNAAGSAIRQRAPGFLPDANSLSERGTLALTSSWELDLWGRLADRTTAARSTAESAEATAAAVRISVAAQVASLYFDLLDLDTRQAITAETLSGRAQSLRLIQARFDEGIASMLDVRQAESLLASAAQSLADQQRRGRQIEHALSVLLGRTPGSVERALTLGEVSVPQHLPAGLPSDLLLRRPDIVAAEAALRAAQADISAARKAYLPRLTLTTLAGFISPDLGRLVLGDRFAWSIEPAVGVSIFDGGRLRAGVNIAESQQRLLVEQYKAAVRQAFREVEDALAALTFLSQQRIASERVALANRDRLRIVEARFLAGISSYFEVLDAERQLFDSELALSQLTRDVHQSVIQLYRALGGGWSVSELGTREEGPFTGFDD